MRLALFSPTLCKMLLVALVVSAVLVACSSEKRYAFEDLPDHGDAARGALLFEEGKGEAPACVTCHHTSSQRGVGPGLAGLAERAGSRVPGQSATEYLFYSIVRPSQYVVRGYSNVMYNRYEEHLSLQDIADLIAYLSEL
jgi:cytochrome c2